MIYNSIKDASFDIKLSNSTICMVLNGNLNTAGGYHWEYVEENGG